MKSFRACLTFLQRINKDQVLDFGPLVFIDPGALVLLHHLVRLKKPPSVQIILPKRDAQRRLVSDNLGSAARSHQVYKLRSPNAFPLRYVESEKEMIRELTAWRDMLQESGACDEESARSYSATMTEVLQNSFTHGRTKGFCVVSGQTFPKKRHSMLVAVDNGIGIPESLKRSGRYKDRSHYRDWEWIAFSLERGVTAKTRETNLGLGLFTLCEQVRATNGTLIIVSERGAVSLDRAGLRGEDLGERYGAFPGTMLILDIRAA